MPTSLQQLSDALETTFGDKQVEISEAYGELTAIVSPENLVLVATELRDSDVFSFEQLLDVCGVDYSQFGQVEWQTSDASRSGFSRGVSDASSAGRLQFGDEVVSVASSGTRFAAVYHLISYKYNRRLRLKVFASDDDFPVIPSVINVWRVADWYEREAFDLFGILFSDHPDLRRILTDYGFVGHPFRKDFPMIGHVEMRYDPAKQRVIYEPVSIEPRVLVPRVKREDHRYLSDDPEEAQNDA
ncbi:MAG: NADH-quinone oxidoreductase subunit C [Gammaproteobacteria bacterium]|jgi:NADH-quinone oxidoreductase subunit C